MLGGELRRTPIQKQSKNYRAPANRLTISRVIATQMNASLVAASRS